MKDHRRALVRFFLSPRVFTINGKRMRYRAPRNYGEHRVTRAVEGRWHVCCALAQACATRPCEPLWRRLWFPFVHGRLPTFGYSEQRTNLASREVPAHGSRGLTQSGATRRFARSLPRSNPVRGTRGSVSPSGDGENRPSCWWNDARGPAGNMARSSSARRSGRRYGGCFTSNADSRTHGAPHNRSARQSHGTFGRLLVPRYAQFEGNRRTHSPIGSAAATNGDQSRAVGEERRAAR